MDGGPPVRTRLVDTAVAAAIGAVVLTAAALDPGTRAVDPPLLAAGSFALAVHRGAPRAVLAVTTATMTVYVLRAAPGAWAALPVVGAVHAAARAGYRALAAGAGAVFLGAYALQRPQEALLLTGWVLCAALTGLADRSRRAYLRQTEQRALDAERTRDEAALRRAAEDRLRVARELHESLTHSVSVVRLQAGVAAHLARKRGEEVPPALLAIQEAGGQALRDLRATLGVLRTDEPTGTPALLVERARAAGLATCLTVTGEERALAAPVERVAYRVVQEALTNAARHAGEATVQVRLDYGERALVIRVDDDGLADPSRPPRPGTGLTGMRERVAALCGTLHAAPRAEGGFSVRAELPLGEESLEDLGRAG
ncbi:histidine kinase [Streptomyces sp. NPDC004539]|uniref:sensor histidine kinase n=1 Tax=Streptomyces sp. NPDC004539 TaxID=3154280 RepID=UPI00339E0593